MGDVEGRWDTDEADLNMKDKEGDTHQPEMRKQDRGRSASLDALPCASSDCPWW